MKISVISQWYNHEFLAPFFLDHYAYADEILIMLDKTTTDRSVEIISRYPNARIEYFDHGGIFNIQLSMKQMNDIYARSKSDWVIFVDADELVFPAGMENPRDVLDRADGNLIYSCFWWVYRHISESDLDPSKPAIWQRRHGAANVFNHPHTTATFWKPNIAKPEAQICWGAGIHDYEKNKNVKISSTVFKGVHWQMADVENAVYTRIETEKRLSMEDRACGRGVCHWTEEKVRARCAAHLHDPQLF